MYTSHLFCDQDWTNIKEVVQSELEKALAEGFRWFIIGYNGTSTRFLLQMLLDTLKSNPPIYVEIILHQKDALGLEPFEEIAQYSGRFSVYCLHHVTSDIALLRDVILTADRVLLLKGHPVNDCTDDPIWFAMDYTRTMCKDYRLIEAITSESSS